MVNEEGENCIVVAPGANANLVSTDIEKIEELSSAEIILMQLKIPMETICFDQFAIATVMLANSFSGLKNVYPKLISFAIQ